MNNPVILIIPDIHGRDFYKEAIREAVDKNIEIVCLGDYLDPYFCDVLHEEGVFAPLSELVELKKSRPHMTHLLLGNHDCSYFYSRRVCPSRYDHEMPFGIMVPLEVMHSCLHCSMIHVSQERDSCSVMPESLIDGYQQLEKEILTSLFNG